MNIIIEDLYTPAYAIPLVAFSPRITGIFNPSYSFDENDVIEIQDNIIEPSIYDEFARQTLWTTSEATLSFRERKDKPHCESCIKNAGECVMVDLQLGYRCFPCLKKQIFCSWGGDILVQAAIGEFDLTLDESKALYERWWSSGGTDPDQDAEGEIDEDQLVSPRITVVTDSAQGLDVTKQIAQDLDVAKQSDEKNAEVHNVLQDSLMDNSANKQLVVENDATNSAITQAPKETKGSNSVTHDDVIMYDSSYLQGSVDTENHASAAAPEISSENTPNQVEERHPETSIASGSGHTARAKRISKPSVKVLAVMESASASLRRKRKRKSNARVSQAAPSSLSASSMPERKGKRNEREKQTQNGRRKSVKEEDGKEAAMQEQAATNEDQKGRKGSRKRARPESTLTNANKKLKGVENWSAQSEISASRAERLRKLTLSASEREHELTELEDSNLTSFATSSHPTPLVSTNDRLSRPSKTVAIVLPPSTPRNQGLIPTAMVPYGSTPLEGTFPPIQLSPPMTQLETSVSQRSSGSSNNSKLPFRVISPGSNSKEQYDNLYSQYEQLQSEYAKCIDACNIKEKLIEGLRKELAETVAKVQKANESRAALEIDVKEKARALVELEARHGQEISQRNNGKNQASSDLAKACEQLTRDNEEMHRRIQDMQHQIHYQHCSLHHQQPHYPQHLPLPQFPQPLVIEDPAMVISALIGMSNQRMMLQAGPQPLHQPLQVQQFRQVQQSQPTGPSGDSSSTEIPPNIDPALFFPVFPPPQQTFIAPAPSPGIATAAQSSSASGRHQPSSRAQTPTQKK